VLRREEVRLSVVAVVVVVGLVVQSVVQKTEFVVEWWGGRQWECSMQTDSPLEWKG
jgi:hypothetical protein